MIPPDHTVVSRLVIRPPNWLGDAVLALPAMAALRRHFASAHLTVAAPGAVASLFREDTGINPDAVVVMPTAHRDAITTLRDGHYDLGVLFPNSFRSAWQLRRAGIPQRWGYAKSARGWLLTRRSAAPAFAEASAGKLQHHSEYYRQLVRGFGIPVNDDAPRIVASTAARTKALVLIGVDAPEKARVITLAPGAAYGQAKQWPPTRVAELVAKLVHDRGARCVLVGAGHDKEAGRAIETWLRANAPAALDGVVNVIGRTDLETLVALTTLSRVCVSNDSGVMHVAAATGRPVVAIFGSTDGRVTRPLGRGDVLTADVFCRPCHLRDCPIDHRCMKRITVDQVFAAVSRHLAFGISGASL